MRILITGGAGYIGSVMVDHFFKHFATDRITVVDNFMYQQSSLNLFCKHRRFDVVRGDARDTRVMNPLLAKHDVVIFLAALVGMPICRDNEIGAWSTNFDAIKNASQFLSKQQIVLYPNTNSGYGIGEKGQECTEDTPMCPISTYGQSKFNAEKLLLGSSNAISFRLATVFGMSPRMRLDLLVNDFVYRAVTDQAVVLFESHFKRNYIHVLDVARVFAHGIVHSHVMAGRAYNVGLSDANLSKRELCDRIKTHIPAFTYFDAPVGEDVDKRDYIVSNKRIESTGFRPECSLDAGIVELIKGYRMLRNARYGNVC